MASHCSFLFKLWSNLAEKESLLAHLPFVSHPLQSGLCPTLATPTEISPFKPFCLPNSLDGFQVLYHLASLNPLSHFLQKFSPFFVTQLYQLVLLQKKVTDNSTQTGLSNKKLHRLHNWKSRGRAGTRVGFSFTFLGFSRLGCLHLVGFFLRLAGREGYYRSGPRCYLRWHLGEGKVLLLEVLLRE